MIEAIQMKALEMLLRQAGYDIAEDSDGKGKVIFNEEAGIHWGPYPENPWGSALKDMVEAASYPGRQECPMCGPRSLEGREK